MVLIKMCRTELKIKLARGCPERRVFLYFADGEGKGREPSCSCRDRVLPGAAVQYHAGGKHNKLQQKKPSVVANLWKTRYWKWSDIIFSGVFFSLSSVSTAVRAQDEDGADASNGRTDTSSSNSVSISNSISSCEVSKIVRSLQMPLASLWLPLLMRFRAFASQY